MTKTKTVHSTQFIWYTNDMTDEELIRLMETEAERCGGLDTEAFVIGMVRITYRRIIEEMKTKTVMGVEMLNSLRKLKEEFSKCKI